jgi:predicted nuclease of predicted toxin-antitoxin system
MLKFHLDENVDSAIAEGLRLRGIDVTMPVDVNLLSAKDEDHLEFATRDGRVLFTHDEDFLNLARRNSVHSGIAYCHVDTLSIGQIVQYLELMSDCMDPQNAADHVEYLRPL